MNAANEIAVQKFLEGRIPLYDIPSVIDTVMKKHIIEKLHSIDQVLSVDHWARKEAVAAC